MKPVLFLTLLTCVISQSPPSTLLYQGSVLGNEYRCKGLCASVCDDPTCLDLCESRYCSGAESMQLTWSFVGVMFVVVCIMTVVLRLLFRKVVAPREMMRDEETARYYHSL